MRSIFVRAGHLPGARVESVTHIAGGSLSSVSRLGLVGGGTAIAKTSPLVTEEATMLEALRSKGVPTPAVLAMEAELLILEDLPAAGRLARAWANLADVLDHLHVPTGNPYGWDRDYAFGNVAIPNDPRSSWVEFWGDNRLRCHLPHVDRHLGDRLEELVRRLGDFLPGHPPAALLHGDLWGGNILVNDVSISGLIDPAAYTATGKLIWRCSACSIIRQWHSTKPAVSKRDGVSGSPYIAYGRFSCMRVCLAAAMSGRHRPVSARLGFNDPF